MSELRVPTVALPAEVTCLDGREFQGRIFVPAAASTHAGPMRPQEWMNGPGQFFPFLPDEAPVPVILNKHEVLVITVAESGDDEPPSDSVAIERRVVVECGARRLEGLLKIDMPANHSRVLDYLNRSEPFLPLHGEERLHLIQKHNITRVAEAREG